MNKFTVYTQHGRNFYCVMDKLPTAIREAIKIAGQGYHALVTNSVNKVVYNTDDLG